MATKVILLMRSNGLTWYYASKIMLALLFYLSVPSPFPEVPLVHFIYLHTSPCVSIVTVRVDSFCFLTSVKIKSAFKKYNHFSPWLSHSKIHCC